MEKSSFPAFRSASLPNPTLQLDPCHAHATDASSSSQMAVEGPITPPLSPGNSEHEDPSRHDLMQGVEQQIVAPLNANGGLQSREVVPTDGSMDVDSLEPPLTRPPARHLEDEQSHVHRDGSLRLTDFEVKGTLGEYSP